MFLLLWFVFVLVLWEIFLQQKLLGISEGEFSKVS